MYENEIRMGDGRVISADDFSCNGPGSYLVGQLSREKIGNVRRPGCLRMILKDLKGFNNAPAFFHHSYREIAAEFRE